MRRAAVPAGLLAAAAWLAWFGMGEREQAPVETGTRRQPPAPSRYVGAAACANCHRSQYGAWQGSHHALAMQPANAHNMLGDFANARFSHAGATSRFSRRDGRFFVNTDGADGQPRDFEIGYAFGVAPLQQYLVAAPGGRLQALSIAWDSRPKDQGGQRWFHLYPNERIDYRDPLHWTGLYQNWNSMCADCHSTEVRHNYDPETDQFDTRWSEINVACEACHGPGSAHVDRAREGRIGGGRDPGLTVRFDPHDRPDRRDAMRRSSIPSFEEGAELKACAACHSRRTALTNVFVPGEGYDQHFLPAMLRADLYYVDGQIRDEVYEYNSFRQSRMAAKGVTCSDCHEPHALTLRGDAETVCHQCHARDHYARAEHHHHRKPAAIRCVDCHMPQRTYMVVDPRRDHSFRVPRPDLSVRHGVPNACDQCHRNQKAEWASSAVRRWLGRDARGFQQFSDAFHAVRETTPEAESLLQALLRDAAVPPLVKGSLLAESGRFLNAIPDELRGGLKSPFVAERLGGLQAVQSLPADARWELAGHLLLAPERNVRIEAARMLIDRGLDAERLSRLEKPLGELLAAASLYGTMPQWRLIAADAFAKLGDGSRAVAAFEAAIRQQPDLAQAYANLADFYRAQGQEGRVRETLERGLRALPNDGALHYALGLHLVREKSTDLAMRELEMATRLAPDDPSFGYGYAVGLYSGGVKRAAISFLKQRLARRPNERDTLYLFVQLALDDGRAGQVAPYRAKLESLARADPAARQLTEMLQQAEASTHAGRPVRAGRLR